MQSAERAKSADAFKKKLIELLANKSEKSDDEKVTESLGDTIELMKSMI